MDRCRCGSYAINPRDHGREPNKDLHLCDVCYWRTRHDKLVSKLKSLQEKIKHDTPQT
jgi:hypothetical protein